MSCLAVRVNIGNERLSYSLIVLPAELFQKSVHRYKFRYSLDRVERDYLEQAMQYRIRNQTWKLIEICNNNKITAINAIILH